MDLSATFKTEVYRPVVTIAIPGAISSVPIGYYLAATQPDLRTFGDGHPFLTSVTVLLAVIALGFLFEDLGSRVENGIWERLQGKSDRATQEWYAYLRLAPNPEPIGFKYIRTIVTRMKFEISTALALVACVLELFWLRCGGHAEVPVALFFSLVVAGVYLCIESYASCKLLRTLRHEMLKPPIADPVP